jgi:hypothetical protein
LTETGKVARFQREARTFGLSNLTEWIELRARKSGAPVEKVADIPSCPGALDVPSSAHDCSYDCVDGIARLGAIDLHSGYHFR